MAPQSKYTKSHLQKLAATTHKKRADDALSAQHMPKSKPVPFKSGPQKGEMHPNFLVEKTIWDVSRNVIEKVSVPMIGASHNGSSQSLYFTEGPDMGLFKGMEIILAEWGYHVLGKKAQCGNSFNCAPTAKDCCMCRMLFNEPDFAGVKSLLEIECKLHGVQVLFLPKFHCELNPIVLGFCKTALSTLPRVIKGGGLREEYNYILRCNPFYLHSKVSLYLYLW